jgi:hypothetical protein
VEGATRSSVCGVPRGRCDCVALNVLPSECFLPARAFDT